MEFCLLGPLSVRRAGTAVPIQRGKQRVLLAALLLKANRIVPTDDLVGVLWESPAAPPSAMVTLRNYVKRLRRALQDDGRERISTHPYGYRINIDPGELDVLRAGTLLGGIRTAARANSWQEVSVDSRAALSLWRGEPLEDVESDFLRRHAVPQLTEMRIEITEARIDAELRLGRYADVVIELQSLTASHPLRENLHCLLMMALHGAGRRADALAAYRHARRILIDELGAEPGHRLSHLHQWMLRADPVLTHETRQLDMPFPA